MPQTVQRFRLPDAGEGLTEAEIVTWRVQVGDEVRVNDVIVEIETAKSLVELPSPFAGVVSALLVSEGTVVEVGEPIIEILGHRSVEESGYPEPETPAPTRGVQEAPGVPDVASGSPRAGESGVEGFGGPGPDGSGGSGVDGPGIVPALPPALVPSFSAATGAGTTGPEVLGGTGTGAPGGTGTVLPSATSNTAAGANGAENADGAGGAAATAVLVGYGPRSARTRRRPRIVLPAPVRPVREHERLAKPPVRKLAKELGVDLTAVAPSGAGGLITRADVQAASVSPVVRSGVPEGDGTVRVPIRGVRKATAATVVASAFTAPHVSAWVSVDVTRTVQFLDRLRGEPEFAGLKLTPLLVAARGLTLAVRRNPGINASWDEAAGEIVTWGRVNLGIAAATPRGLLVPNIKDAGSLPLRELAMALGQLTSRARQGLLSPAELTGGTITITNVGVLGIDAGTPILNNHEAAILCLGQVRKLPWVHKGKVRPRWVTQLAISFDHRLIDGDLGGRFLGDIAAVLEHPDRVLAWS